MMIPGKDVVKLTPFALAILLTMAVKLCAADVCSDLTCIKKAYEPLLETYPVDPCEDMYTYSCGVWQDYIKQNSDVAEASVASLMQEETDLFLKQLIEEPGSLFKGKESSAIKKLKDLYKTCMDEERIERHGVSSLLKHMNNIGSWTVVTGDSLNAWDESCWDITKYLLNIQKNVGLAFVAVSVDADRVNKSKPVMKLFPGGLMMPIELYYVNEARQQYISVAARVAQQVGANLTVNPSKIGEIFDFEKKLIEILETQQNNEQEVTLAEFQKIIGNVLNVESYLSQLLRRPMGTKTDKFILNNPGYFQKIGGLIQGTKPEVLANYMMWNFLKGVLPYLPKAFNYAEQDTGSRSSNCLKVAYEVMPYAVNALYGDRHLSADVKNRISGLVERWRLQFMHRLDSLTWLDGETRTVVKTEVGSLKPHVGYPDWIMDTTQLDDFYRELSMDADDFTNNYFHIGSFKLRQLTQLLDKPFKTDIWKENPYVARPRDQFDNNIVLQAGLIRPPVYNITRGWPYVYGTIGSHTAHKIIHLFDETSVQRASGWTNYSMNNFKEASKCLIDQYNSYNFQNTSVSDSQVLDDIIATNGGIGLAFKALKELTDRWEKTGQEDDVKYEQLFFLGYTQLWCTYYKPEQEARHLENGNFAHPKYRILAALSNSKHFAKAFSCPSNARLNPDKKCEVW